MMTIDWEQLKQAFIADIQREMTRWYPQLLARAWDDAGFALGIDTAFDLANPKVQDVIHELLTQVVGIADTTIDETRTLFSTALEQGLSVEAIARQIREAGVTRSTARARVIAHTESAYAYSKGSLLAYDESGVVSGTEWLTANTDVCPICEPLNGKVVALHEVFTEGIVHPPAHPTCRCALAPVVE